MGQRCACGHSKGRHQTTNLGNVTHCADCGCGSFSEYELMFPVCPDCGSSLIDRLRPFVCNYCDTCDREVSE